VKYQVSDSTVFRFRLILLVVIVLTIIFIISEAANSQTRNCTNRDIMVEMLNKTHGETVAMVAHSNMTKSMIEFLGRSDGTTWTIIITYNNDIACITAAGDWWMIPKKTDATEPINSK